MNAAAAGLGRIAVAVVCATLLSAPPFEKRGTQKKDLLPAFQDLFSDLNGTLADIEKSTAARLREGESDHLIFYVLQSTRFTSEARIEPALSARDFEDRRQVPPEVRRRIMDFLKAPLSADGRLADLRIRLKPTRESLLAEYSRAMRFLYEKEFRTPKSQVSGLYQSRGHSTDTQVEANYAVWNGLAVLKALNPKLFIQRALVIGPGLDFAPRTDLFDDLPPQSYQPYALADALIGLKLANSRDLRVHCLDINPRVAAFINEFPGRKQPALKLISRPSDEEYARYFANLGTSIGNRRGNTIEVRKEVARSISATQLNILTERLTGPPFDLVVMTNVLLYFNSKELALALINITGMMKPGGYFIHNDLRPEIESDAGSLGLKPVQARLLRVARGNKEPLFDSFAIYVKRQ